MASQHHHHHHHHQHACPETPMYNHFDFIIVGGGTAGLVVAARLAENPKVSVLVVEAGIGNPREIEEITTPSMAMGLRGSKYDWAYKTTMVKRDDYERIEKPNTRGKALGGSSSLNYFTWVPGCKETFDAWEKYGGKEWTWEPLKPYLRKSVTYHDDEGLYDPKLKEMGGGGPVNISHADLIPEMKLWRESLTKAWVSTGQPLTEDVYNGTMRGLNHCVDTIYKGQRSGSWLFLHGQKNITILSETVSRKLLICKASHICHGVEVIDPCGIERKYYARREVILSQGVFESPKLLMLSGVGPRHELEKHHIECMVESRHVGQNLMDHPAVPFVLKVKDGQGMEDHLLRPGPKHEATKARYFKDKTGPLGSGALELIGFPRLDDWFMKDPLYRQAKASLGDDPFQPGGTRPHFELDFVCMFGPAFQWHYPMPKTGNYMSIVVDCVRTVSPPGEVTLHCADPLVQPNINLNFFQDDLDIVAMRQGIRFTYDLLTKGEAFKDLVVAEFPWEMELDDDVAMKRAVLDRCQTAFHPTGTARLSHSIEQGVVDPHLKVHGVHNLRVIDASVIPIIPDCRIQNSVYMVAEKGADCIKASHKDLYP